MATDLKSGVSVDQLADGAIVAGQVDGEDAILVKSGGRFYAVGAACTHYRGPLAEGLVADGTVRCPWHHARFDLATGEAARAPALDPLACWRVERARRQAVRARETRAGAAAGPRGARKRPRSIVIVGGGAAGQAAAEMLRARGLRRARSRCSAPTSAAGRPAQPLQGLPRGQRARGVDPAARRTTATREQRIDLAPRHARDRARRRGQARSRSRAADALATTRCCSPPAPSRCGSMPGADPPHVLHAAHARRQPRDHRRGEASEARAW